LTMATHRKHLNCREQPDFNGDLQTWRP